MDEIARAAGVLLGSELSDPVDLGGAARSKVLRCRTAAGGSVIVKAFGDGSDARRGFTAEAAGLSLGLPGPAGGPAGPELMAVDPATRLLVMADLGGAPTLADLLLADEPKAAERGLLDWARGLGRLAAGSVSRRADFARLWERYDQGCRPGRTSRGSRRTPPRCPRYSPRPGSSRRRAWPRSWPGSARRAAHATPASPPATPARTTTCSPPRACG